MDDRIIKLKTLLDSLQQLSGGECDCAKDSESGDIIYLCDKCRAEAELDEISGFAFDCCSLIDN